MSSEPHATQAVPERRSLANPRRLRVSGGRATASREQRPQEPAGPDARPA